MESSVARGPAGLGLQGRKTAGEGLARRGLFVRLLPLLMFGPLLVGCGQKGPLFLPLPLPQTLPKDLPSALPSALPNPPTPRAGAAASSPTGPAQGPR